MPLTKPGVAGRVEEKYEALRLLYFRMIVFLSNKV